MAKDDETPRTNPAEIESLIEQIRGTNLDPRAKDKIERLLRTVRTLVELLQRKNTSINKCPTRIRDRAYLLSCAGLPKEHSLPTS
jgi:hypothetical protein